ncbi:hypothetical protein ACVWU4_000970 [Campylobacter coli]
MTNIVFTNSNKTSTKLVSKNDKDVEVTLPSVNGTLCTEENVKDVIRPEKLEKIKQQLLDGNYLSTRNHSFTIGEGEIFETLEEALLVTGYISHLVNETNGFKLYTLTFTLKAGYNWTKPIELTFVKHRDIVIKGDKQGKINIPTELRQSLLSIKHCTGVHFNDIEINQNTTFSSNSACLIYALRSNFYSNNCNITLNVTFNSTSSYFSIYYTKYCTEVHINANTFNLTFISINTSTNLYLVCVLYITYTPNSYIPNNTLIFTIGKFTLRRTIDFYIVHQQYNTNCSLINNTYKLTCNLDTTEAQKAEIYFVGSAVGSYVHLRGSHFYFLNEFTAANISIIFASHLSNITPESSKIYGLKPSMVSFTYWAKVTYCSNVISYGDWKVERGSSKPTLSNRPLGTWNQHGFVQELVFGEF